MAIRDVFKVSWRTFFNPVAWVGVTNIKATTGIIWNVTKNLFRVPKPEYVETFEAAKERLQLTEADIQKNKDSFLLNSIIFVCLAGVMFSTSFYFLFRHHTFLGWLIANLVTLLFLSQALRFHFWYFQIKHRKLGCTFQEWWQGKPNIESPKS